MKLSLLSLYLVLLYCSAANSYTLPPWLLSPRPTNAEATTATVVFTDPSLEEKQEGPTDCFFQVRFQASWVRRLVCPLGNLWKWITDRAQGLSDTLSLSLFRRPEIGPTESNREEDSMAEPTAITTDPVQVPETNQNGRFGALDQIAQLLGTNDNNSQQTWTDDTILNQEVDDRASDPQIPETLESLTNTTRNDPFLSGNIGSGTSLADLLRGGGTGQRSQTNLGTNPLAAVWDSFVASLFNPTDAEASTTTAITSNPSLERQEDTMAEQTPNAADPVQVPETDQNGRFGALDQIAQLLGTNDNNSQQTWTDDTILNQEVDDRASDPQIPETLESLTNTTRNDPFLSGNIGSGTSLADLLRGGGTGQRSQTNLGTNPLAALWDSFVASLFNPTDAEATTTTATTTNPSLERQEDTTAERTPTTSDPVQVPETNQNGRFSVIDEILKLIGTNDNNPQQTWTDDPILHQEVDKATDPPVPETLESLANTTRNDPFLSGNIGSGTSLADLLRGTGERSQTNLGANPLAALWNSFASLLFNSADVEATPTTTTAITTNPALEKQEGSSDCVFEVRFQATWYRGLVCSLVNLFM